MELEKKVNHLEKEVNELKIMVMQQSSAKKIASLKGLAKGVKFKDSDIEKAKKSLFKGA